MHADTTRWRLQTALFIRGQRSMTVNIISVYGAQYMTLVTVCLLCLLHFNLILYVIMLVGLSGL